MSEPGYIIFSENEFSVMTIIKTYYLFHRMEVASLLSFWNNWKAKIKDITCKI